MTFVTFGAEQACPLTAYLPWAEANKDNALNGENQHQFIKKLKIN